jgi:hypothetical protein
MREKRKDGAANPFERAGSDAEKARPGGLRGAQIFGACPAAPRPPPPPPRPPRPPLRPAPELRRDVLRRRPEPPANCTLLWLSARDRVLRGPLSVLEESCIQPHSPAAAPPPHPPATGGFDREIHSWTDRALPVKIE